jgi:hypothetical protein
MQIGGVGPVRALHIDRAYQSIVPHRDGTTGQTVLGRSCDETVGRQKAVVAVSRRTGVFQPSLIPSLHRLPQLYMDLHLGA